MKSQARAKSEQTEAQNIPTILLARSRESDIPIDEVLPDALHAVRVHLGMDVAFVSQFTNGRRKFRYVDTALEKPPIKVGDSHPLEESYCQRVVDGRLPELIHDATQIPAAMELQLMTNVPVGAHLSVPIRLSDGSVYGTLCCFSASPDQTLSERDLAMMRALADFAARQIERRIAADRNREQKTARVQSVLDAKSFSIVYQPIYQLERDRVSGFESLTRFSAEPRRSPDVWFNEAAEVGLGEQLEMAAIEMALLGLDLLPKDVYVSLNVSPANILSGAISRTLSGVSLDRIVLEVTEHEAIPDYSKFGAVLEPLRKEGLLLAVDDAGAGFASFRHILQFSPDIIKLDISLTRDIDKDCKRRALAAAIISFAKETRCKVIAEGVETESELRALRELKVNNAQGYLLGRPMPLGAAASLTGDSNIVTRA